MRLGLKCWLAAAAIVALPAMLAAQPDTYPSRTVKLILGPASDAALRVVADGLQKRLGKPVIVEARPGGGGGGEIAVKAVSSAPPDGYTFLFATSTQAIATALQVANFDIINDFAPVTMINLSSFVLVVHPSVPATNLQELIAFARAKPGTVNCAYAGRGSPQHLACQMFAKLAKVELVQVPYRDAASMANALIANHVHMLFSVASQVAGQIDAGTVRALAVSPAERTPIFPQLPTMTEAGLPGFEMSGWGSLLAPAKTPSAIVERINAEVVSILAEPDVKKRYEAIKLDIPPNAKPDAVGDFIRNDIARWNRVIDLTGVQRGQ